MTFRIADQPWDHAALEALLDRPDAGGRVTFEGRVRDRNEGRPVHALKYECYPELTVSEGHKLLEEAMARFPVLDIVCVHRVGRLCIGEPAVWIGVCAAHREAAFDACRFVIDALKQRLPIWKKEVYTDGGAVWLGENRS